ncbi:MAG: WXG100 family type VII secretion target [Anaerolineaceae bacterium]|nr:WXG100 family type VII secretion target [Anaerolineaceae bacterium]
MPSGNSMLRVRRDELENTGMTITSAAKGIGEAIADAARRINALDGNWQGMSNQNFMPEFNQSRIRAAAVSDGLTRLGRSLQEIGINYESADSVPIEFDMNIEQDASGKVSMSYSFIETDNGRGAHAYNQFDHNGDGSVSVDMQEVGISADGQSQLSHLKLDQENFNTGGYEPAQKPGSKPLFNPNGEWMSQMAEARAPGVMESGGLAQSPDGVAPTGQQERLQDRVADALGGLPGERPQQSLEERITGMNAEAGDVLDQVKGGESPTNAAAASTPRASGGGGGMPMQMSPMPPLQQPQSTVSADLLRSAVPPEGYKDGDSLADKLMTAMVMDNMMDDSPLNRAGGGGGFSGDMPQGVGTMDLTDSMQTLGFPGEEVTGAAPELDVNPAAENPLEGIEQDFFEEPREMNIKNVNPRNAEKD